MERPNHHIGPMYPLRFVFRTALALLVVAVGAVPLAAQGTALGAEVFATIRDRVTGEPVIGATGVLTPQDGQPWTGTTDENGRFRTPPLSPTSYGLTVTRGGYATLRGNVQLEGPGAVDLRAQMVPLDFALEPVIALAARRTRLEEVGFYDRLRFGDGHFITRDEIEHHAPTQVSDVLRGIPGVRVVPGIARANQVLLRGSCVPRVVLDGLLLSGPVEVDHLLPTIDVAGIEVYHGTSAPILYTGETTCGVIMLWSRTADPVDADPHTWKRNLLLIGFSVVTMLGFAP